MGCTIDKLPGTMDTVQLSRLRTKAQVTPVALTQPLESKTTLFKEKAFF